ncbi:RHS repeat-associated core domain-containing protein [Streptomyces xiangluensis]|uniref:RHS repeat-associated core domain-containing protein n=1 Tax=Streptomyces xiangluensis TaxID=2665720 RepID=A0ABV8YZV3_9ACTN
MGYRPTDWHVLDLDKDPTPGDPDRVRSLARQLHAFADDVQDALRLVKGMADEDAVLSMVGKTAEVFREEFSGVPKNLKKLKKSYDLAGDALAAYWPKLERAQALADKALVKGREAQADLASAKSRLSTADSWVTRATKEADKYKDDPGSAGKDVPKPDESKVRAATRDATSAKSAQTSAQSDVTSAQSALDAAKKMAADARQMREDAAREAKNKLEEASDAGIQNRAWYEEVGDWVSDNWDTIVTVCKVVVAVVGIIAMIIGGPILGAIVLVAALVVLADTLNKYAKGQASLWDVAFAALDCIPGMKGLTTLGGLAKGLKSAGAMGLKGMAKSLGGLAKNAKTAIADGAKGAYNRLKTKVKGCGDPVDVATGQMFLATTDITLPGALPLSFSRRVASDYRSGWWFGPTWASTIDQRLEVDEDEIVFVTEDGLLLAYPHPAAAQAPVLPDAGPRIALVRLDDGRYRIDDPLSGHTRHFARPTEGLAALTRITDRNGNAIDFDYDEQGAPLAIRYSVGYHLQLTTDEGRVTALSLAEAAEDGSDVLIKRYGYTDGNLTEVTNSSGLPIRFTYDERLRITSWTDTNNSRYVYTYDDQDRCTAQSGEAGHLANTFTYDGAAPEWPDCRITTVTTAEGARSRFVINDTSQVIAEIDPLGAVTRTEYDEHHHLLSRTDVLGNTTSIENNALGQPTMIRRPDGGVIAVEYDAIGLPVHITEPDGAVWEHTYDDRGNRVSLSHPDGALTRFTYDAQGNLESVTDPLGATTHVRCNAAGLRVETVSALGDRSTRVYDSFGRLSRSTDPLGHETRLWWTVEGKIARVLGPDGSEETWCYDGEGNCTAHTNSTGARTTFEYTHFDLLAAETGPDGGRHEFTYDPSLRLTQVTNPLGLTWQYTYDSAGRLVAETDFDEQRITYERDAAGRVERRVNPAGQSVRYTHDAMGRPIAKAVNGQISSYGYDPVGRLIRAASPGCDLEWERDRAGRIVAERLNGRTLASSYDAMGRRVERITPSGARASYQYDVVGRPTSLSTSGHTLDFAHDAAGQEISRLIDESLSLVQTWDAVGRPLEQRVTAADKQVQRRTYGYREDHHLVHVEDTFDGSTNLGLDNIGRISAVESPNSSESYAYDDAGRIKSAVWSGRRASSEAEGDRAYSGTRLDRAGSVHYEYDAAGRIIVRRKKRLSRKPDIWQYTWDAEDRLTSVVTPDGTHWRYLYDPLGRRIAKQHLADDGRTVVERTDFTWDGPTLAEQTSTAPGLPHPVTLTWDHEGHRPIAQTERITNAATQEEIDSRFFAVVTDLVGTPTELIDEQGAVAWRARRTTWGLTAWPKESQAYTPLRFPGQYQDPETGLHYNYQRYYDPETARYTSLDPLGLAPAPNPYGYVNNPLRQIDPFGLMSCGDDTVVLYHGSQNWTGPNFSLDLSNARQREYTPDAGVYLTDDFMRAAQQYAGPNGTVVRVEVPREFAESVYRQHGGPAGDLPEYFVNTQEGLDILNAGSPRALPQGEAFVQNVMGQF